MLSTHVRPSRDLRNNYAEMVKLLKQHDHIIITNNGVGESVLISIEDYAKYEEFLHRRFINEELKKAEAQTDDPNAVFHDVAEVFGEIKKRLEARGIMLWFS